MADGPQPITQAEVTDGPVTAGQKSEGGRSDNLTGMRVDSGSAQQDRPKTLFRLPHNYH